MTLLSKLKTFVDVAIAAILRSDSQCQAEKDARAVLEARVIELESDKAAAEAFIADATGALNPSTTPGRDAVIEAANDAEAPNTPAIDEAIAGQVGTDVETSEEAEQDALDILIGDIPEVVEAEATEGGEEE